MSHALHSSLTAVPLVGGAYCGSPQAMDMQVLQDAMDRCAGGLHASELGNRDAVGSGMV